MSETYINFAALPSQADAKPARDRSSTKEANAYDDYNRPDLDEPDDTTTNDFEDELRDVAENAFAPETGEGKATTASAGDLKIGSMEGAAASLLGQSNAPQVVHISDQASGQPPSGVANDAKTNPQNPIAEVTTGLFKNSETLTGVSALLSGTAVPGNKVPQSSPAASALAETGKSSTTAPATISMAGLAQGTAKTGKAEANTPDASKGEAKPSSTLVATSTNPAKSDVQSDGAPRQQGAAQPETTSSLPAGPQTAGGQAKGYGNETRTAKLEGNDKVSIQALENPATPQGDAKGIPFKVQDPTPSNTPNSETKTTVSEGMDGAADNGAKVSAQTTTSPASDNSGQTPAAQTTTPDVSALTSAAEPTQTPTGDITPDGQPSTSETIPTETAMATSDAPAETTETAPTASNEEKAGDPPAQTTDNAKPDVPRQSDSQIAAATSQEQIAEQSMAPTAEQTVLPIPTSTPETFDGDPVELFSRLRGGGKLNAVGAEKNGTNSDPSKGDSNSSPAAQNAQAMAQAGHKAANPALQNAAAFSGQTPSGETAAPVADMGAMALSTQGFASLEASLDGSGSSSPNSGMGQNNSTETSVTLRFNRTRMIKPPVKELAVQIAKHVSNGASRFDIRIDPPELGRIDVQLEISGNGKIMASLMVDRPETLDMLQRDAKALERALIEAGLDADSSSLSFSLRDHANEQQFLNDPNFGKFGLPGAANGAEEGEELDVPQNGVHIVELDRLDLYV